MELTTAQIGKAGELLVQQKLLLNGIESAPLATDAGIDLVAYSFRRIEYINCFNQKIKQNKGLPGANQNRRVE